MPNGLKRRLSQANGTLSKIGRILWKHLADFLKTNPKICSHLCEKASKATFLRPKSSKIIVTKEKERRKGKSEEKERRRR